MSKEMNKVEIKSPVVRFFYMINNRASLDFLFEIKKELIICQHTKVVAVPNIPKI